MLRVIRAYRTASTEKVLVVVGLVLVHLLANERQGMYRDKLRKSERKKAKEKILIKWRNEWVRYGEGCMEQAVDPSTGAAD